MIISFHRMYKNSSFFDNWIFSLDFLYSGHVCIFAVLHESPQLYGHIHNFMTIISQHTADDHCCDQFTVFCDKFTVCCDRFSVFVISTQFVVIDLQFAVIDFQFAVVDLQLAVK